MDRSVVAPEPNAPRGVPQGGVRAAAGVHDPSLEPVMTLRGAQVAMDPRRAGRAVLIVCIAALVVATAILTVAGFRKNAQITALRQHGVPVAATVTKCIGLMGGSGSNAVGYACNGTYRFDGHRYSEAIPGNALHVPGAKVKGIAAASSPGLFSTPSQIAGEHASWTVFIVPLILLAALIAFVAIFLVSGRSADAGEGRRD